MRAQTPSVVAALAIASILVLSPSSPDPTSALTVAAKWGAKVQVGSTVPQGTATLYVYTTGSGALGLRLTGLRPSTNYWVALYSGTCSRLGARVMLFPTVTSSANGTVVRGLTFRRDVATRVRALLRGTLSVAIGSVRRCGTLARQSLTPSPTPTATPTPTPISMPTPTPTPTPYVY